MHVVRGLFKGNVVPLIISFKFRQYSYLHCASYKSDIPQGAVTLLWFQKCKDFTYIYTYDASWSVFI